MELLLLVFMLALNFAISWSNAAYCGRYWTESKHEGGSFRVYIICGYIMAICGFTMVYGYVALLIAPAIMQMFNVDPDLIIYFQQLSADLIYVMIGFPVISTGFYIWIRGLQITWENRTLGNILASGWNTYAQIHNTISYARNMPSALGRIVEALLGGKKKKGKEAMAGLAILLVIVAALSGYFTASAIMKKADREYDLYADLKNRATT